jgi:hypothetical protein
MFLMGQPGQNYRLVVTRRLQVQTAQRILSAAFTIVAERPARPREYGGGRLPGRVNKT